MDETAPSFDWYGPDAATFGDRVAGAREVAGMSQHELARRLGVKLSTLRAWEEDRSEPRANRLQMLSGLLNVSLTWLLNGVGDGPDAPAGEDEMLPSDINAVLIEMRTVRADLSKSMDRLSRLEKRLRQLLK